ncbi:MAG: tRNA dihydrouridine synthase DusB [Bacteroidales bacterium]|nr:tRNA dihydrouridine synthase DusB [Bacteroidales bacterium]
MTFAGLNLSDKPLFLAPMEDVTDSTFRYICKMMGGVDVVFTEFVSSDGLVYNVKKSFKKLQIFDYERPIGIQIYGNIPERMVEAAKMVEEAQPDFIDINFGCPVKKIANRGAGSGMMKNVPLMVEITEKVVKAVKTPVTVKTRLGWDEHSKNILEIALRLQDVGIQGLTIHGRTRSQMYTGTADWTLIGEVKHHPLIHIPIIGNGDVTSPIIALEKLQHYGVDGIMIGRGSIGKPWIFKQIKHFLETGELLPEPTIDEKIAIVKTHLMKSVEDKGEYGGILTMRRHYVQYFKGLLNSRPLRIRLLTSVDFQENLKILDEIHERYKNNSEKLD